MLDEKTVDLLYTIAEGRAWLIRAAHADAVYKAIDELNNLASQQRTITDEKNIFLSELTASEENVTHLMKENASLKAELDEATRRAEAANEVSRVYEGNLAGNSQTIKELRRTNLALLNNWNILFGKIRTIGETISGALQWANSVSPSTSSSSAPTASPQENAATPLC